MNFFGKSTRLQITGRLMTVVLCCLFAGLAYSQPKELLEQLRRHKKEDTVKAKLYYEIARNSFGLDTRLYKAYTDSSFRLASRLKFSQQIALTHSAYGFYYSLTNEWGKTMYHLKKSDSIYKRLGDTFRIIKNQNYYTNYYKFIGDYDKALKNCLEILRYYDKHHIKPEKAALLGEIGGLLDDLGREEEAEIYYRRAIDLFKELKNDMEISRILLNIGGLMAGQKRYAEAESYLNKSLDIQKKLKDEERIFACKLNLAFIYSETNRPQKAVQLVMECDAFYEKYADTVRLVMTAMYKSTAYRGLKQYDKAIAALSLRYPLIKGNPRHLGLESNFQREFYQVYKTMGNTDLALKYLEGSNALFAANQDAEIQRAISRAREEYETEKKQEENKRLKKENELKDLQISQRNYLVYGSILLLILISIIAVIIVRNNRLKAQKATMKMEQRLLQSQMNPHFTFNVLNAIHNHMLKRDTEESGTLLTSFARLVRSVLQHSSKDTIPLTEELNWLKDYIRLQQSRFTNSFNYVIEIDDELSPDNVLLPPMLIQPFIENAIEHGFTESDKSGELRISYKKTEKEQLEIRITDNGKGFSTENAVSEKKGHESMALQITEKRIHLLNKRRKGAFKFEIASKPSEGTTVLFSIPYRTLFD
ncbi:histidine kinase [Fluviicola sp.]|uniref:tetratricopeptide repeat-containing sensor histidine kinase n=1 Tax=Fluviicola sp. TaxID=1917219 RepID=UPI0031E470F8